MTDVEGEIFARKVKCKEIDARLDKLELETERARDNRQYIMVKLGKIEYLLEEHLAGIEIAMLNIEGRTRITKKKEGEKI